MNVLLVSLTLTALFIYNIVSSVVLFLTPMRFRKKKDITGQRVLITGAGNGLGRQLAVRFSQHATCLVLLDVDEEGLSVTSELTHPSSRVLSYVCDVSDRRSVYAVAEKVKDAIGEVDIVVNNAGVVCGKSLIDLPDEKILKTMEVNALSHFWICKSFLPSMMARNKGHLVTVSSVLGFTGLPRQTDYCASKYAAVGFTEALELELRNKGLDGIRITLVCPSLITTGLFDGLKLSIGEALSPQRAAEIIVEGILLNKEIIIMPWKAHAMILLKLITPRWLNLAFYELTDTMRVMETFKGRRQ